MCLFRSDTQMMKLHLCLCPGECGRAFERHGIVMLVGQIENTVARGCRQRPKRDARCGPARDLHAPTQAEDWIEHSASRIRKRPAIGDGSWIADALAAAEESRPIGLE